MLDQYDIIVTLELETEEGNPVPPPMSLEFLELEVCDVLDHTALLDGLLWSCHQSMMSVSVQSDPERLSYDEKHAFKFLEFLCQKLLNPGEENPDYCREYHNYRCWRHYLKNVKAMIDTWEGKKDLEDLHGNALSELLKEISSNRGMYFVLEW